MKKILSGIVLITMSLLTMNAQTEQGKWLISGASDLTFSSTTTTLEYDGEELGDSDATKLSLTPVAGYFIADGLAIGMALNVENSKQDDYTSNSLTIGPFARYYFGNSNVKPFLQGALLFGSSTEEDDTDEADASVNAWELGGGVAMFINNFLSVDMGLGYGKATATSEDDNDLKLIMDGISFNVGFSVYL